MTLVNLAHVLQPALKNGYAVPGFVCLGWEDMCAFVTAAEDESAPVILQAGPGCREHTPLPIIAKMFRYLAENASVPVVAHLDHGYSFDECRAAIGEGFTSLMFDGSRLPLQHNIDATAAVVELAHAAGASCEGEIGFVGYAQGKASQGTDPEEASRFVRETAVDAVAVSVGNIHLQKEIGSGLDLSLLDRIKTLTSVPLVIHGGSGVPENQRAHLAATGQVSKFNIGTELRMVFGAALRQTLNRDPARFDRNEILKETGAPMVEAAKAIFRNLGASGRI
jgi:fructose-bisphosphate aldolase, class II